MLSTARFAFWSGTGAHRDLRSFPTRRTSDLPLTFGTPSAGSQKPSHTEPRRKSEEPQIKNPCCFGSTGLLPFSDALHGPVCFLVRHRRAPRSTLIPNTAHFRPAFDVRYA